MNKLIFYIDDFDQVKRCIYIEDNVGSAYIYKEIKLPPRELYDLFFKFEREREIEPIETDMGLMFEFYEVDVFLMDELMERTENYKKMIDFSNDCVKEIKNIQNEKITRKNKFKRTAISISSALLLSLSGFILYKTNDNLDKVDATETTISDSDLFASNDINLKNDQSKNEIIYYPLRNNNLEENNLTNEIDSSEEINSISDSLEDKDEDLTNLTTPLVIEEDKYDEVLQVSADDWIDTEKYYISKAYYLDAISKYAKMYGLDPNLVLAIGTHESGMHSENVNDGGAVGLFQIQVRGSWNWSGRTINAYNFENGEYESFLITEEGVSDIFENIKVGCMMIQDLLVKYDYNVAMAVTAYNYGENYLGKVVNKCSEDTGISIKELKSLDNLEWLNYRWIIANGDPLYLENVFKYIPDGTVLKFEKPDGSTLAIKYENMNSYKKNY